MSGRQTQTGGPGKKKRRRRNLPWKSKVVMGLAVALLLLAGLELGLRVAGFRSAYEMPWKGNWLGQPNLSNFRQGTRENPRGFLLNTNSDGMRTTLAKKRTPGVLRVALMGDSTTFGWGVDDGYTLGDSLGRSLNSLSARWAGGARKVELLNAAQSGYTTTQVAWLFEKVVAKYRPDWVLVFVPLHDYNLVLVSDRESLSGGQDLAAGGRVMLSRHSRIYALLRRQLFPQYRDHFLMPDADTREFRVPRVSNEERRVNLDGMRALLKKWNGRLMVGFLPTYIDLTHAPGGEALHRKGDDWIIEYSRTQGVPLIDLRTCCGPDAQQATLPNDKGHLSAMGNALVAAAAARVLAPYLQGKKKK